MRTRVVPWFALGAAFVCAMSLAAPMLTAAAQADRPSIYTATQATAGREVYTTRCAACHLDDLGGNGDAPPIAGPDFIAHWRQKTTTDLLEYLKKMPPGGPALSDADYLTVLAYLLEQNGAVAGPTPLSATTSAPVAAVATGRRPAP